MEKRELNLIIGKPGGTAGKGSYSCKTTIPSAWAWDMGFSPDDRVAVMQYDEETKTITITKK